MSTEKKKFSFGTATLPKVDETFGLRQIFQSNILDKWIQDAQKMELTELEINYCQMLQQLLLRNVHSWQEQELSLHFIGPMFSIVDFTEAYRYNLFAQRYIEVEKGNYLLSGTPDGLVASGYYEPQIPYFAFSEYKRQRDPNGDPAAQALAAMLAGQVLNGEPTLPMYGCFVIGSDWKLMVLDGKHYCISRDYSALSQEVYDILKILKALKEIIIERTAGESSS